MAKQPAYERITTQLPTALAKRLKQEAKRNERPVAAEIRVAVIRHLDGDAEA